ncbi:uncharacterized protein LOC111697090 isoform X2 [Eurytemora carolleeae]|uniref:uncharacterized protein LOC111697090 isoform X2 n=1 Tax=Eurytemora carolleeae TaxID=1294199 RepID=UPI000C75F4B3|nr:uncharacterized protein LOC111697090 isoform X2 [Eurytemora carolleeae]|eukprot:XP_023322748.1 uncharacterized protein LOC111697090 isoform X2 [Eurytemora affinis]
MYVHPVRLTNNTKFNFDPNKRLTAPPRSKTLAQQRLQRRADAPKAQDSNANLVRAEVPPPSHDINANYGEPSYLIQNKSLEKDISAPIKMREELLNTPTLMRKEAVSASNRMIEEQLIPQTLKRTDVVSTPTRMREEQLNTPTLMRTEAVSASNRMREEQLNTPTLMKMEAVSASNRIREEQLNTPTLMRTEAVSASNRMREEQLNTPTLMRMEAVSASNRMKEEQLNTPSLMRTKKLLNMSSNKENEFSFLSNRREDNVKDSCSPLSVETFKRSNTSRVRAPPGGTNSAARSSKHAEVPAASKNMFEKSNLMSRLDRNREVYIDEEGSLKVKLQEFSDLKITVTNQPSSSYSNQEHRTVLKPPAKDMVPAPTPEKNFVPTSFKGFVKAPSSVANSDQNILLPPKTSSPPARCTQAFPVKAEVSPSPVNDMMKASILPTTGKVSSILPTTGKVSLTISNKPQTLEKVDTATPVKDARIPAKERLGVKGCVTPVKPIEKKSPSKSPPYGEGNCICMRALKIVMCQVCSHDMIGRVMKHCVTHPEVTYLMDYASCCKCRGTNLKEFDLPAHINMSKFKNIRVRASF